VQCGSQNRLQNSPMSVSSIESEVGAAHFLSGL
jgi:hypothetical protein